MKRVFVFLIALIMILTAMTACNKTNDDESSQTNESAKEDDSQGDVNSQDNNPSGGEGEQNPSDEFSSEYLVSHIQIKSGANTISPFGSLLWSKIDNGDGTFTESIADMPDTKEIVNIYADVIPKLVLSEKVSYLVQVNGSVENVYLLSPKENGYTKAATTFDALSNLEDGTYYVAFNVLLSGNCDPDAPQNSYRYEDIFCLVVGEQNDHFNDHVPYESMLNLEIMDGKFRFQRIATTPCIVYSNTPITEMSKGTIYNDRHDILTSIFQAMDGKDAIRATSDCLFSHYIYMFDNEREKIPWHYRFAICTCGAVMITNNDELICTIQLTEEERRSIFPADLLVDTEPSDTDYPIGEVQIHPLYEKYPEYWHVDGMKGVEVYVWMTKDGSYRCGALTGTNRLKTNEEIQALFDNGATIEEMRTILELCEIDKDHISVIPVSDTLEDDWYKIDIEEISKYQAMFWGE